MPLKAGPRRPPTGVTIPEKRGGAGVCGLPRRGGAGDTSALTPLPASLGPCRPGGDVDNGDVASHFPRTVG